MPPKYKARTSLLTGKITVRVDPNASPVYYHALWLHEKIHQLQRMRMIRRFGRLKGAFRFITCRKEKDCTWILEREAYKWQILYLRGLLGRGRVFRDKWITLLSDKGYPKEGVKELWHEIEQIDDGDIPYCLGLFLDRWCAVPF